MDKSTVSYSDLRDIGIKSPLANVIDSVSSVLFCIISVFLIAVSNGNGLFPSLIISLTFSGVFICILAIIKREQKEINSKNHIEILKKKIILERFSLEDYKLKNSVIYKLTGKKPSDFKRAFGGLYSNTLGEIYIVLPLFHTDTADASEIARAVIAIRKLKLKNATVLSAAPFDADAIRLSSSHKIRLIGPDELISYIADNKVSEEELYSALKAEKEEKKTNKRKKLQQFTGKSSYFYFFCAAVFSLWPFIFGFSVIYSIIGGLCVVMGIINIRLSSAKNQ